MNNYDNYIREKIINEYNDITPDSRMLQSALKQAKAHCENKDDTKHKFLLIYGAKKIKKCIVTAAAVVIAFICFFNVDAVEAFVKQIYEKYFIQAQVGFEQNTKDYIQDLGLEYEIEGEKIIIKQYVVTEKGVDFKIVQDKNSKINICACEIISDYDQTYDEMLINLGEYIIASNVVSDIEQLENKNIKIAMLYYWDGEEDNLYTKVMETKLNLSKVYQIKELNSQDNIVQNDNFSIDSISLHTWYMKVVYEKHTQDTGSLLLLKEEKGDIAYASGSISEEKTVAYYQLPETIGYINAGLGYVDNDNQIIYTDTVEKIDLQKILKEDTNE